MSAAQHGTATRVEWDGEDGGMVKTLTGYGERDQDRPQEVHHEAEGARPAESTTTAATIRSLFHHPTSNPPAGSLGSIR